MASLRADVGAILDLRVPEPKSTPAELAEDTVLTALFTTTTASLPPPCEHAKRHRSSCTSESEEARARKNERTNL